MIVLSTGEADLYAINKSVATGIGGENILKDLGVELGLRIFTDATTGKSLASRRGLGKARHIAVNELWLQSHIRNKSITIVKIKNKFNPSDILTKHLTNAKIQQIMEHLEHFHEHGRPNAAPKISILYDHPIGHDSELHRIDQLGDQYCHCNGIKKTM